MNAASLSSLIMALAVGNTLASLGTWQILTDHSPSLTVIGAADAPTAHPTEPHPALKRVQRQTDSAASRLFGTSSEIARAVGVVQQDVPQAEPAMRLVGIMLISETDDHLIALVEYGSPARVYRLRNRDTLQDSGWRVERIGPASADFVKQHERRMLELDPVP